MVPVAREPARLSGQGRRRRGRRRPNPAPGAWLPGSLEDGHNRLSERKWAMSAVSPESRRASANLPGSARDQQANGAAGPPGQTEGDGQDEAVPAAADFGPNEALVDELYQRYLNDPASVDRAWWNFFADYRPTSGGARLEQAAVEKPPAGPGTPTWPQAAATGQVTAAAPAAPPAPVAAPAAADPAAAPTVPPAPPAAAGEPKASSPAPAGLAPDTPAPGSPAPAGLAPGSPAPGGLAPASPAPASPAPGGRPRRPARGPRRTPNRSGFAAPARGRRPT